MSTTNEYKLSFTAAEIYEKLSKIDTLETRVNELSGGDGTGLTTAQINALDGMFKMCAYTGDASKAYSAFKTAFGIGGSGGGTVEPDEPDTPTKTLTSISAVYSGGSVTVGTAVTMLTGVMVTAHYSDGSAATVTGYTLSGTIAEGNNTVTVTYQGKTTAFTVTGTVDSGNVEPDVPVEDNRTLLYHWDFTGADPLIDLVNGAEAQVNSGSPDFDSDGLRFKSETDGVKLLQSVETFANQDIEIDIGNISGLGNAAKHLRLLTFNTAHSTGLISRNTTLCWSFYSAAWTDGTAPQNSVSNKTVKLSFDNADNCTAYLDGEEIIASTAFTVQNMMLGSNSNSAKGIIVKALRIYRREE